MYWMAPIRCLPPSRPVSATLSSTWRLILGQLPVAIYTPQASYGHSVLPFGAPAWTFRRPTALGRGYNYLQYPTTERLFIYFLRNYFRMNIPRDRCQELQNELRAGRLLNRLENVLRYEELRYEELQCHGLFLRLDQCFGTLDQGSEWRSVLHLEGPLEGQ